MCSDFGDVEGLTIEDIMQKTFRTDDDAYEFYKNFSRLDRRWVHKPETRTNCKAKFSVHLDKNASIWQVRKINNNHNHELTPYVMVHLIPKYRSLTEGAKAQIDGLRECGISTAKTMRYMAGLAGGYLLVGFLKDAYNYIDKQRCEQIVDGDVESTIAYLEGKAKADSMLMAQYNLTKDRMLANMFWADGGSRLDYQYFGDVLAFDSTYKKNKYNRPLTKIFGFGLVLDETIGSYTWLLKSLLEVMCQKMPSVVVTNGDEAMREAVRVVFPRATHWLLVCKIELRKFRTDESASAPGHPINISKQSKVKSDDQEWFFFNELKHIKNKWCNRKTNAGYWEITGKERIVKGTGTDNVIGTKRTLVFYKRPHSVKTNWVLHEYHALDQKSNIVLSRVIKNVEKREKKVKRKASNIIEEEVTCEPCSEMTGYVTEATTEDAIIPDACVSSEPQPPQDIDYEILSPGQQSSVAHSGNGSNNAPLLPFEGMWKQDAEMNTECF
ncbi:hypothetical protein AHAS_Ahas15G0105900 [Arachis hypogaea]